MFANSRIQRQVHPKCSSLYCLQYDASMTDAVMGTNDTNSACTLRFQTMMICEDEHYYLIELRTH